MHGNADMSPEGIGIAKPGPTWPPAKASPH